MVKCLPTMWETWVRSLGWEDLLEKEMATHSSTLAWKILWKEEPGRLPSMRSQRVGHGWVTYHSLIAIHHYFSSMTEILKINKKSPYHFDSCLSDPKSYHGPESWLPPHSNGPESLPWAAQKCSWYPGEPSVFQQRLDQKYWGRSLDVPLVSLKRLKRRGWLQDWSKGNLRLRELFSFSLSTSRTVFIQLINSWSWRCFWLLT